MREYEFTYIVQPDAEPDRLDEIHKRVESIIEGGQGRVLLRDDWGKRKLAYEISKFQKGHYFLVELLGDGKFVVDLERALRLDADVLRFMTVLVDDRVADIDARVERAKTEDAERAERRAERERLEAERHQREQEERARSEAAAPPPPPAQPATAAADAPAAEAKAPAPADEAPVAEDAAPAPAAPEAPAPEAAAPATQATPEPKAEKE
jgi:small subunit ribosomal protein S6